MKTVNTSDLNYPVLDWAVDKALGADPAIRDGKIYVNGEWLSQVISADASAELIEFCPSISFAQGAEMVNNIGVDVRQYKTPPHALIDPRHYDPSKGDVLTTKYGREMVLRPNVFGPNEGKWYAQRPGTSSNVHWTERRMSVGYDGKKAEIGSYMTGDTLLIAAMRHIVASLSGLQVRVPKQLLQSA